MEKLSELIGVVGTIDPDANTTATLYTDYIDMQDWRGVLFVVMAGILATSGTLDFSVVQYTSTTGGGAATLSSGTLNITQMTTGDNDEQTVVEVLSSDLSQKYRYIRGALVVGGNTGDSAVIALGVHPTYNVAADFDLSSVGEIKG